MVTRRLTASISSSFVAALVALLSLPPLASAQSKRSASPAPKAFSLRVPEKLALGTDRSVMISYRAPESLRAQLFVDVGTLDAPARASDGSWVARYTPPAERFPQSAIFALVSADGAELTWARLALCGVAKVELDSDPDARVSVQIGSETFGPVATDARGHAVLPVVIPPGVSQAVSIATDALGNERRHNIPLDVPSATRLLSVCPPEDARGFWVFALNEHAQPASDLQLVAHGQPVVVSGVSMREPGVYRVGFDVPPSVRAGELAQLSAAPANRPREGKSCQMRVPLEPPEKLEISLSRASFSPADPQPIRVRITPRYRGAREPEAASMRIVATLGELSAASATSREPVELEWKVPSSFGGQTSAELLVRAGRIQARAALELVPGPLHTLAIASEDAELPADGAAETQLTVEARDAAGNPTGAAALSGRARGQVGAFRNVAPGRYEASYRAPAGLLSEDEIIVQAGAAGLSASHAMQLRAAHSRFAVGGHLGVLTNFAKMTAPMGLVDVSYRLPFARDRLRLALAAGYYQSQHDGPSADAEPIQTSVRAIPVLLRVDVTVVLASVQLWPLIGAGALLASSNVGASSTGEVQAWHIAPLWAAGAGMGLALGPGRLGLELAYWGAHLSSATVSGNASGAHATVGYDLPL